MIFICDYNTTKYQKSNLKNQNHKSKVKNGIELGSDKSL